MSKAKRRRAQNRRDRRKAKASGWRRQGTVNARKKRHHVYESPWVLSGKPRAKIRDDAGTYVPQRPESRGFRCEALKELAKNMPETPEVKLELNIPGMDSVRAQIEELTNRNEMLEKRIRGIQSTLARVSNEKRNLQKNITEVRRERDRLKHERDLMKHLTIEIGRGHRA